MAKISFDIEDPFSEFDRMFEEMRRRMDEMIRGAVPMYDDEEPVFVSYRRIEGAGREPIEEVRSSVPMRKALPVHDEDALIDVREKDGKVTVLVELPGIAKEDIDLEVVDKSLVIDVDVPQKRFSKEVELPCAVKASSTRASYRNGVLEVVLDKNVPRKRKGTKVKVE